MSAKMHHVLLGKNETLNFFHQTFLLKKQTNEGGFHWFSLNSSDPKIAKFNGFSTAACCSWRPCRKKLGTSLVFPGFLIQFAMENDRFFSDVSVRTGDLFRINYQRV